MEEDQANQGMERRSFLKRSALVAGATVWAAPTVQSLMSPAFAHGTGLCPPDHMVAFKYEVGRGFVSGSGNTGCVPDGYDEVTNVLLGPGPSATTLVDGKEVTVTVTVDGETATITISGECTVVDLDAKGGNTQPGGNGDCLPASPAGGDTWTVTLSLDISYVIGVLCC